MFARSGYHEATLEEIARQAAFGKGTIYNYFASKEELFDGILMGMMEEYETLARSAVETPGGAREKYAAYARALLAYAAAHGSLLRMVMRELMRMEAAGYQRKMARFSRRTEEVWRLLAAPLAAELAGRRDGMPDTERLAALFDSMLKFAGIHRPGGLDAGDTAGLDSTASLIVSLFFDGVRAQASPPADHHSF